MAFCQKHRLCKQTFYNWRLEARRGRGSPSERVTAFAEVAVAPSPGVTGAVRVHLASGLSIDATTATDPIWLRESCASYEDSER